MDADAARTAQLLHEIGQRLALAGDNPYRARAYSRAADSLRSLLVPLKEVIAADRLRELPGVGEAMAAIIPVLHDTGTHPMLDELRSDIPASVLEMLAVPGLKPEKVLALFRELGIRSSAELEAAARDGVLARAKRLGPALERKVLDGIEALRAAHGRIHLHRAAERMEMAEAQLRETMPQVQNVTAAGDFRRGSELVGDLVLVGTAKGRSEVLQLGEVTALITDPDRRGITKLLATGAAAHVDQLRALAASKGCVLTPEGLRTQTGSVVSETERDIYAALGLAYIEPELREGTDEIELAASGRLPTLVTARDMRGILHAHTTASDGGNTLGPEPIKLLVRRGVA